MNRIGAIVRLLMLVAALLPFDSERQATCALAPFVPLVPASESSAPTNDDQETLEGKERPTTPARNRAPVRELTERLSPSHPAPISCPSSVRTTPSFPVDPFNNGLGTHYRC